MKDNLSVFDYVWEVTFHKFRLKLTPKYHTSWNTIYRVAKLSPRDFDDQNGETVH